MVVESEHGESLSFDVSGSWFFVGPVVARAVDLDNDLRVEAGEVGNEGTDRDLTTESDSEFAPSQGRPQSRLGP
jgi:hypothetical protein